MKKNNILAYLLALPLALACIHKDPDPEPLPEGPQKETRTLTFVLPSYEDEKASELMKSSWVEGDQIVIHGEWASDEVTITLASGDISADGKTATKKVDGLLPYLREDCGSTLYASYPADAVDNLKHCFFYSKFSKTDRQLLAAYNSSDCFNFQNVCGAISFKLEGDYDSYNIVGARKEVLGYEFLQVKLTDKEENYRQYYGDPLISIDGIISGENNLVWLPDGMSLSGLTIKFGKEGKFTGIYGLKEALKITRGTISDIGDISEAVAHYDDPFSSDILDLDANGNANCYMITDPGTYKFKAVKGNNSTAFLENVSSASVLWESWNNAEEVTAGSVLTSVSFAEDYMIVKTPEALKAGNALIAALDMDGNVIWSWHIWVPVTEVTTGNSGIFGKAMMDRNLGALVVADNQAAPVAPESFGMMYQWGRKDPFPAAQAVKSSAPATAAGIEFVVAPGQISLESSILQPTLLGHIDNGDWLNPSDATLWRDDIKTIYDPCPPGYRVPASGSNGFWGDCSKTAGWSFDKVNGWYTLGSPASVFPLAGYRDDYGVGSITHNYDRGLYWSSASSDAKPGYGRGEDIRPGSSISFKETPKARAGSVRCVVE